MTRREAIEEGLRDQSSGAPAEATEPKPPEKREFYQLRCTRKRPENFDPQSGRFVKPAFPTVIGRPFRMGRR